MGSTRITKLSAMFCCKKIHWLAGRLTVISASSLLPVQYHGYRTFSRYLGTYISVPYIPYFFSTVWCQTKTEAYFITRMIRRLKERSDEIFLFFYLLPYLQFKISLFSGQNNDRVLKIIKRLNPVTVHLLHLSSKNIICDKNTV